MFNHWEDLSLHNWCLLLIVNNKCLLPLSKINFYLIEPSWFWNEISLPTGECISFCACAVPAWCRVDPIWKCILLTHDVQRKERTQTRPSKLIPKWKCSSDSKLFHRDKWYLMMNHSCFCWYDQCFFKASFWGKELYHPRAKLKSQYYGNLKYILRIHFFYI